MRPQMTAIYACLALMAGLGLAVQVGLNNGLRARMGHPIPAALVSFALGTLALALFTALIRPTWPEAKRFTGAPGWIWFGGVVGACYVATTATFSTKLGAARWLALVVTGQILTSIVLDHFGLVGFPVRPATVPRVVGVLLLLAGVAIVLRT